jgi:hypothetical protein
MSPDKPLSPEKACEVLHRYLSKGENRLEHGAQLRDAMFEAIKRGEKPTGYRAEWLRKTAMELIATMEDASLEFNLNHPDDQISAMDLMDVLATAMGVLKREASK